MSRWHRLRSFPTGRIFGATGCLVASMLAASSQAYAQVAAHRSENHLPSSNGLASIAYNVSAAKIDQFLEHPYRYPSTENTPTRNFVYDNYPGIRVGTSGAWLDTVAPTTIEYIGGTGIVHVVHSYSGYTVEEFHFAPLGLTTTNASITLLKVTNTSGDATQPVSAYNLYNFHLGSTISGSIVPGVDGEGSNYDSGNDAIYEYGPSNVVFAYGSIGPSTHHGMGSPNPYTALSSGTASDLADTNSSSGMETVPGLETSLGTIAVGASAWAGWYTAFSPSSTGGAGVASALRTFVNSRTPAALLSAEESAWSAWVKPVPAASGTFETALAAQAQVTLKMAQVTEPNNSTNGTPNGQMLASIAPGMWNISWVRDMAYAVNGFVATGHYAEAKAALQFQMNATVGQYQSKVGFPYAISVVRYFGNGTEESDSNADGPNIEFDGFGLFLWSLDQYTRASGDMTLLTSIWPTVKANVANTLVSLQEPGGLISADSSIWEVHWDGQQRHFAYTTITAANGLCAASHLATLQKDTTDAATYLAAGQKARDAILANLRAPDGTIAQSTEGLAIGSGFLDAATLEAINFGLVDPSKRTANATLASMKRGLVPMEGHGFMRSDVGDYYSSQEWIFVDLRSARAFELTGDTTTSTANFTWNVDQATENFGELSELHDATTANYAGESPMVGFGAGAYLMRLAERGQTLTPACGSFAAEPDSPVDAGAGSGDDDGGTPGGEQMDGSTSTVGGSTGGGTTGGTGGTGSGAGVGDGGANDADGAANSASASGDGDSSGGCAIYASAASGARARKTDGTGGSNDGAPIALALAFARDDGWTTEERAHAMSARTMKQSVSLWTSVALTAVAILGGTGLTACGSSSSSTYDPRGLEDSDAGIDGSADGSLGTGTGTGSGTGGDGSSDGGSHGGTTTLADGGMSTASDVLCPVSFSFVPPAGSIAHAVTVAGEWNNFDLEATKLTGPDANGAFSTTVSIAPGMTAYELVVDGTVQMDPNASFRKFLGTNEFGSTLVGDCSAPSFTVGTYAVSRVSSGKGEYKASVTFVPNVTGAAIDPSTVKVTLRKDGATTTAAGTLSKDTISFDIKNLADGKYSAFVDASDVKGNAAPTQRLVFWIEASTYDWQDALLYMVMTDRFQDGDPSNNPAATGGVDPRVDYHGGDLEGVMARVNDGTFDKLGVRVLWLSPFNTAPPDPWIASDGIHATMGYHGYWPIKAREVDARIGGGAALKALTAAAHAHGIRVIQDLVINQVHQEHEYFQAHPEWFRTGCVCGTNNCDWTVHRLDCLFATYMPDVNWTLDAVNEQYDADAIWWMDSFDLDGFRMDAVKQVEDSATVNLSGRLRREFEAGGSKIFLTGETAMGWNNCDLACNASANYDLISSYIGPHGLTGQFDFPAYYAVPMQSFVADYADMNQVDYWTQASGWEYPTGAIMSPYVGSQDTARFVSIANNGGENAYNQWDNIATTPTDPTAYPRHRLALSWLFTIPGAPMIYYGDEYSENGGVDPNNRVNWRGGSPSGLSADEQTSLAHMQALGQARKNVLALRRGIYTPIAVTSSGAGLLFARDAGDGQVAIVALSKSTSAQTLTATLPQTLGVANGATLHDQLGGPNGTVNNSGVVSISLPAWGSAILTP